MRGGERWGIQPSAVRVPTGLGEVIDDLKNTVSPPPAFCLSPCVSMFYVLSTSLSACHFQNKIVKEMQRVEPDRLSLIQLAWIYPLVIGILFLPVSSAPHPTLLSSSSCSQASQSME